MLNVLGLRRDVLTAGAYGVDEFLLVYGDRSTTGRSPGDLTVGSMLDDRREHPVIVFGAYGASG
jgi:hypothetical protein